jgi:hypothetical protein
MKLFSPFMLATILALPKMKMGTVLIEIFILYTKRIVADFQIEFRNDGERSHAGKPSLSSLQQHILPQAQPFETPTSSCCQRKGL